MKYKIRKISSYELNLNVDLDRPDLEYYVDEAKKYLANDLKLQGFRKGKAPLEIAKDKLDKSQVLETAFDLAFRQTLADVLVKERLELIEANKFEVKENSLEKMSYSISLLIFPEFKLGQYKQIEVKPKDVKISEEEIDQTIEFIRNSRKTNGVAPDLNDEFAKSLGDFKDLGELKKSIEGGLRQEKEIKESQRIQGAILDKIANNTKIEIPPILLDRQLDQMMFELDSDLHQQNMELGLFLAKIKKTQEELRNEWKPKAELLVKKSLILKEIAKKENIKTEPEEVKEKMNQFLENFGTLDQIKDKIDLPKLTNQIDQILLNQKILNLLEREARYAN